MASGDKLDLLEAIVADTVRQGIAQLDAEDPELDGRCVTLQGRSLVNFSSCSYLGLEVDDRLRDGAIDAVRRYGTQFSASRIYVSAPPYAELEERLGTIFGGHVIAAPSTTLGHLSVIPTLIDERDAVILDHQVHNSVQMAVNQVRVLGTPVEILRHSRMDLLEERLEELRSHHRHVWYMADGVYSMYGDVAPHAALLALLERYEQLHLYVDDAHGMSWAGRHGRGVTLERMPLHERMVLVSSLNKAFAAAGGALVFPHAKLLGRVRACGGPLLFSGPIQPPMLGAALASAAIHLSDEIGVLQAELMERIEFARSLATELGLPLLSSFASPIHTIGLGLTLAAQKLVARLMLEGFYVSVAQFPAVPMRKAGVRFTLTRHHKWADIEALVSAIARNLAPALEEAEQPVDSPWQVFGLRPPEEPGWCRASGGADPVTSPRGGRHDLRLERCESIEKIPAEEWDRCLGGKGAFDWSGVQFLEQTFAHSPPNDWQFRYYRVLDRTGRTVVATFFTESLWKADMLAPESVSRELERRRQGEPDYLTTRSFAMGSLLTEGDHLYVDPALRETDAWKNALSLVLDAARADADELGSEMLALRDLPANDDELNDFLRHRGFARLAVPDSMVAHIDWQTEEEFLGRLSPKARYHQRRQVQPFNGEYAVEILGTGSRTPSDHEHERFYELYLQVKRRKLELNTFDLPEDMFQRMLEHPSWELCVLRAHGEPRGALALAVGACFVGPRHYVPTVLGLDYEYVESHGLYRQSLRHALLRAQQLGLRKVFFGMGAGLEKRRFGAKPQRRALYVQVDDHYAADVIAQMSAASGER